MRLRDLNSMLRRINAALEGCLTEPGSASEEQDLAEAITVPILELQEDHFLYRVVEHEADETIHDGEALDFKVCALLAAQAAIAAIFLGKSPYNVASFVFIALAIMSLLSLRLWTYGRAPKARLFAGDFIQDQKAARENAIVSKLEAIDANKRLLHGRGLGYTGLLIATVLALVVFSSLYGYNNYENGHRANHQRAVLGQPPGPSPTH